MANTVSSQKRVRHTERRTEINRLRKTRLRHQVRAMRRTIDKKDHKEANAILGKTFSLIDRSVRWGIIKKNTAARYKSRISTHLKKLAPAA